MNQKVKLSILIISIVLLFIAGVELSVRARLDLVEVVVANEVLSPRTKLSDSNLSYLKVPKQFTNEHTIYDKAEVINSYTTITDTIYPNQVIDKRKVEQISNMVDAPSLLLKANQATFALEADILSSLGNTLLVNQYVDLYGVLIDREQQVVAKLLERVRIIGIKDSKGLDVDSIDNKLPKVIILAIDKAYIPELTMLNELGRIDLSATTSSEEHECIKVENELWNQLT